MRREGGSVGRMADDWRCSGHRTGQSIPCLSPTSGSAIRGGVRVHPITPDFRQEHGAGKPHAGTCAGGSEQSLSLPRPSEMSLFNGLQATRGQFYFSRGPFPRACVAKGRLSSIPRPTAMKRLAGRKRPGAPGIMAVDIARSDRGIGIRLTQPSLFCKELSIWRHFIRKFDASSFPGSVAGCTSF